jgi:hypothetical protein
MTTPKVAAANSFHVGSVDAHDNASGATTAPDKYKGD